jgi:fumarate hydratase, class II
MTGASANNENWRTEKDALGEVRVPAEHLWGAQTERSRLNFVIGSGIAGGGRSSKPSAY